MPELLFEFITPDGKVLPKEKDWEAHEGRIRVRHLGCGGVAQNADPVAGSELLCSRCGGKWRETYGPAGLVRLPLHGGYFPTA